MRVAREIVDLYGPERVVAIGASISSKTDLERLVDGRSTPLDGSTFWPAMPRQTLSSVSLPTSPTSISGECSTTN
jgi:hypothetical protein